MGQIPSMSYSKTAFGRAAKRRWRKKARYQSAKRQKRKTKEVREYIRQYKASAGCSNCGESDPCCLHIHHIDPSEKRHARDSAAQAKSINKARLYLTSGVVLCANCHAKLHHSDPTTKMAISSKAFHRAIDGIFNSKEPQQIELFGTLKQRVALRLVEVLEEIEGEKAKRTLDTPS